MHYKANSRKADAIAKTLKAAMVCILLNKISLTNAMNSKASMFPLKRRSQKKSISVFKTFAGRSQLKMTYQI